MKWSHHEALGVSKSATSDEILNAFRKRALLYHPDRFHLHGAEFNALANQYMQRINQAKDALL